MECWSNHGVRGGAVLLCSSPVVVFATQKEMDETALVRELKLISGLKVKIFEPLARYTSMKIGGPADFFIEVETSEALVRALPLLHRHGTSVCLPGNGSK